MAKHLTGRREKFAQAIFEGLNQSEAYRKAFTTDNMAPATVAKRACDLMKDERIVARIGELRAPVVAKLQEKYEYSLQMAMAEAQEAFQVSKGKDNGAAMVAAVTLRAKLNGLMVERKEVTLTQVQQLSDEDLDRLIAVKMAEAGMAQAAAAGQDGAAGALH